MLQNWMNGKSICPPAYGFDDLNFSWVKILFRQGVHSHEVLAAHLPKDLHNTEALAQMREGEVKAIASVVSWTCAFSSRWSSLGRLLGPTHRAGRERPRSSETRYASVCMLLVEFCGA